MKQEEYFKIKSCVNGIWNSKLFLEDYRSGMHGIPPPIVRTVKGIRFMKEIGMDPHLTSEILPEYTLAGKTKLIIKIVITCYQ